MNFYDEWLGAGAEAAEAFRRSPVVASDAEIPWTSTRQDARVKLMISRDLGFPTMGGCVLKAQIPVGEHTGEHAHGEESIHIVAGTGLITVSGAAFEFRPGTTIQIPYRAAHQLWNTGDVPVEYVSAMVMPLERYVHLGNLEQLEERGENQAERLAALPAETSQYLGDGRRVTIHLDQAPEQDPTTPWELQLEANKNQHYNVKYLVVPGNGFRATSVAMAHIFEEPPGYHGGRHAHLEAVLYILNGHGYSEIEGVDHRFEPGDVLHVPPAMFEHEHYNDTDQTYRQLRIQFGIRYWFTDIWPEGYESRRIYDAEGKPLISGWIARQRER
jgi:quercetin dioxygenase-like cupin family protein